jgi:hypothetical protein
MRNPNPSDGKLINQKWNSILQPTLKLTNCEEVFCDLAIYEVDFFKAKIAQLHS